MNKGICKINSNWIMYFGIKSLGSFFEWVVIYYEYVDSKLLLLLLLLLLFDHYYHVWERAKWF